MLYEELKKKVDPKLASDLAAEQKKLCLLRKRADEVSAELVSLSEQQVSLASHRDSKIAEDRTAFNGFVSSLKKINAQVDALSQAMKTLTERIVPEQERLVNKAKKALAGNIYKICADSTIVVTFEMKRILSDLVKLNDEQVSAIDTLYNDYQIRQGIFDSETLYPKPVIDRAIFSVCKAPLGKVITQAEHVDDIKKAEKWANSCFGPANTSPLVAQGKE